jgi:hypothetical protein
VRGRLGVWVAWITLAVYWGCVIAAVLLRQFNDPAHAVWGVVSTGLIWGHTPRWER